MNRKAAGVGIGLAAVAMLGAAWAATGQDISKIGQRREFMRKKLTYAQGALEGITVADLEKVAQSARALKAMSQASLWEDPAIPNVANYIPLTREFQRICDEMARGAEEKNLDAATLAYVQLTVNCVKCHKYVRMESP